MTEKTYESPAAFRRALTDRLATFARSSRWSVPQLHRQVAYDRLLQRLYLLDDGWILKGATALIARDIGVRGTIDIDVYRNATSSEIVADLRSTAALDVGDWFRFEVGPAVATGGAAAAVRVHITATIGTTIWESFHVDVVGTEVHMTAAAERVPPLVGGVMPGIDQQKYRVYPLVDHVADKVAAIYERHGIGVHPSTRYRDLVDLVAIVTAATVDADPQRTALLAEFARRALVLPSRFSVPEGADWEGGYARESRDSLLVVATNLADAVEIVGAFVNPVLDGTAHGRWDPAQLRWE